MYRLMSPVDVTGEVCAPSQRVLRASTGYRRTVDDMSDGQTPQHGDPYTSRPVGQNPFEQAHTQAHTQALPAQQPAEAAAPRRRRTGIAAAVVATSLVVGAGAGISGACGDWMRSALPPVRVVTRTAQNFTAVTCATMRGIHG